VRERAAAGVASTGPGRRGSSRVSHPGFHRTVPAPAMAPCRTGSGLPPPISPGALPRIRCPPTASRLPAHGLRSRHKPLAAPPTALAPSTGLGGAAAGPHRPNGSTVLGVRHHGPGSGPKSVPACGDAGPARPPLSFPHRGAAPTRIPLRRALAAGPGHDPPPRSRCRLRAWRPGATPRAVFFPRSSWPVFAVVLSPDCRPPQLAAGQIL